MRCIRGLIALIRELWGSRIICWKKLHKGKFSSFVDLWSFWKWKRNEKFSRINSDFFSSKTKKNSEKKKLWNFYLESEYEWSVLPLNWLMFQVPQPNSIAKRQSLRFDSLLVIVLRFVSSREFFWCWRLSCSLIVRARFLLSLSVLQSIPLVTWQFCLNARPIGLFYFENEEVGTHRGVISVTRRMNLWFDWENFLRP